MKVDYALAKHIDCFTHHPVYGDPSGDAFIRGAAGPLHRGSAPYEWPVNCHLTQDAEGALCAFVSLYPKGYFNPEHPCCAKLYRSQDSGEHFEDLGVVLRGENCAFSYKNGRPGCATDASVIYSDGLYHMAFGWASCDNTFGGAGYGVSERVGGPYRTVPVYTDGDPGLEGTGFTRCYACGILRRKHDFIMPAMLSTPGNAGGVWALCCMTSKDPNRGFDAPVILLSPYSRLYHPPLAEFFPYYVHRDYLYAQATSVAGNRTYNCLFRAPLEEAHHPGAWELVREGSLWHWEPSDFERFGLWGQTYSSLPYHKQHLALYPTRDAQGIGAIGLARCGELYEQKPAGFRLSAPNADTLSLLRNAPEHYTLSCRLTVRGTGGLLFAHNGFLGADRASADSAPLPDCLVSGVRLQFSEHDVTVYEKDTMLGRRSLEDGPIEAEVRLDGSTLTLSAGSLQLSVSAAAEGCIGVFALAGSYVDIHSFVLECEDEKPACFTHGVLDCLLCSGRLPGEYEFLPDSRVRTARGKGLKWCFQGSRIRITGFESDARPVFTLDGHQIFPKTENGVIDLSLVRGRHALYAECPGGCVTTGPYQITV